MAAEEEGGEGGGSVEDSGKARGAGAREPGSVEDSGKTRGAGAREPKEVGVVGLEPRSGVRSEAGWSLGSPSSSPSCP